MGFAWTAAVDADRATVRSRTVKVLPFSSPLDQAGGLEAIHLGHLDIEQNDRELFGENVSQRLRARLCFHQTAIRALQQGFEGDQVLGSIVDQQDVDAWVGLHGVAPAPRSPGGEAR
jgi:hypothetical protein